LQKKSEEVLALNNSAKKLFQVVYTKAKEGEDKNESGVPTINVSDLISKMSFYYEKIRNSVDYKEEYLLRKNAIERILKRHIIIEGVIKISRSDEIAKHLLVELIRAGYVPNNSIPETKIEVIGNIIEKYLKLRNYSSARLSLKDSIISGNVIKAKDDMELRSKLTNWFISLAASEIENSLGNDKVQQVVVSNLYEYLLSIIKLPPELHHQEDIEIQIYLGIHKHFLKYDDDMLSFILFKYYNSNWKNPKDEELAKISQNVLVLKNAIDKQLDHPLKKQLKKIISKYTLFYNIFLDVVTEDPIEVYEEIKRDPKAFPRKIKNVCNKEYQLKKAKLWRAAFRSIVYIFLTKSILVLILEIPATKWFGEVMNPVALTINVAFPAVLLFLVVFFSKVPSEENTLKIIDGINELIFIDKEKKESFILRKPIKRGPVMGFVFGIIYLITFLISFGGTVWILDKIQFSWVSIILFLFFLAFASFFGIRIRKGVNELNVIEPKESIFSFLLDFFYVPIMSVGKYLSEKFSKINVIVFILDFIIEAPFKFFVEMSEEWSKYVKERKEDL
jgi:hypothetical protein